MSSPLYESFYDLIRQIPEGRVATYGQIARLAGHPRAARQVGYALNALRGKDHVNVPWHRVINAKGEISTRADPDCGIIHRELLEHEDVEFGLENRIDLERFGWAR